MLEMIQRKLRRSSTSNSSSKTLSSKSSSDSYGTDSLSSRHSIKRRKTIPGLQSLPTLGIAPKRLPDDLLVARLPVVLWRAVISQCYGDDDLRAITLVCRTFYTLGQPYLFREIVFHPFANKGLAGASWAYRRQFAKRVEFLLRPHIASAVTHFTISPSRYDAGHGQSPLMHAMESVIDDIFTILPNFNLTSLICNRVEITSQRMTGLRALRLRSITLDSCSLESGRVSSTGIDVMPLETVCLTSRVTSSGSGSGSSSGSEFLSLFTNPEHLRRLYANPGDAILCALLQKERPFLHLTDLDISLACIPSQYLLPALARCPHLKRLSIHRESKDGLEAPYRKHKLESLPSGVVPELAFYRGPHAYLHKILHGRKLQTLDISFACKPDSFLKLAERVDDCHRSHVESLVFPPARMPPTFLGQVLILFPNLRFLNLKHVSCTIPEWHQQFAASELTPPPRLRAIYFELESVDPYVTWEHPSTRAHQAISTFAEMFPLLTKVYPQLLKVQMLYSDLVGAALVWRKDKSGTTLHYDDIRVEVDVHSSGGKGRPVEPEEMERVRADVARRSITMVRSSA